MPKFETIVKQSKLTEDDKKMLLRITEEQTSKISQSIKITVEKNPEMLPIMVDLIKLKILKNKKLNKRYLKNVISKKLQAILT